jgi:hypothetical protein
LPDDEQDNQDDDADDNQQTDDKWIHGHSAPRGKTAGKTLRRKRGSSYMNWGSKLLIDSPDLDLAIHNFRDNDSGTGGNNA